MNVMSQITRDDLTDILNQSSDICISILLPTNPDHFERQQEDKLQLKNLLRDAEQQLAAFDETLRVPDIAALLEPAARLLRQSDGFWREAGEGVVIYLASGWDYIARLPLRFEPQVVVGREFYVKPLVPLLTGNGRFFILGLCQNDVCFFEATRDSIRRIPLSGVPTSLEEALAYDDPEKQSQFHTSTSPAAAGGRRSAVFFGHGTIESQKKDELLRFCQQVDAGLQPLLRRESAPLLVACVDYLFPIFQEANSYAQLLPANLSGNPSLLSEYELLQHAWPLVKPVFEQAREEALGQYGHARGMRRASAEVDRVVVAAHHGRVETLFTVVGQSVFGRYDAADARVEIHNIPEVEDEDLLDTAVRFTLRSGGTIYALPLEEMPEGGDLAAIFRY